MNVAGIDSRLLYTGLVAAVAVGRLLELRIARRNAERTLARGGFEVGQGHYRVMVALHAAWLAACPAEVWLLDRALVPPRAAAALVALAVAVALRWWAIATLGERWSTRVIVLPAGEPVTAGPYRWLRHPNYLAVVLEIAALPLIHGAWLTALVFSLANVLLLRVRIATEEAALEDNSSYSASFAGTPRLLPRIGGGRR